MCLIDIIWLQAASIDGSSQCLVKMLVAMTVVDTLVDTRLLARYRFRLN